MRIILAFKYKIFDDAKWYDSLFCKIIKWWTHSDYYHVELAFDNLWITSDASEGGIVIKNYKKNVFYEGWDYYALDINISKKVTKKEIKKFILEQEGKKYDWLGILFTQFIHFRKQDRNKWFCSEIDAEVIRRCKYPLEKKSKFYSPGSLYKELESVLIKLN